MSYGEAGGAPSVGSSLLVLCASWFGAWWGAIPSAAVQAHPACPACPSCVCSPCTACPACPLCSAAATCGSDLGAAPSSWQLGTLLAFGALSWLLGIASVLGCGWCRSRWSIGLASEGGLGGGAAPPPLVTVGPGSPQALAGSFARTLAPRLAAIVDQPEVRSGSATPSSDAGDSVWTARRRK
jgi:hypothetical protein